LGVLPLTAGRVVRWHLYNGRSRRQVRATLERLRPDLIIAWNLYMASAAPLLAARGLPAPLVAHPADMWLVYSLDALGALIPANNRRQRWFLRAVETFVQPVLKRLARPDYLLAVSEFIRQLHTERGYPTAQSRATWLGVHTDRFPRSPHPFPAEGPWRLVFAGQLWAGKGPQVAIEAVHLLRQRSGLPPVELDLFGGGAEHYQNYLRGLVRERGLEECVRVRGFTPQGELAQAFRGGSLFLFCSIWDEPFSGGLLEAMATGLPTIATTAGGTLEAVRHEENSLVVPPDDPQALADAIARLMGDPALYARIGAQAAHEVAGRWSFDAYIDRLECLYAAIVAGHRKGAPIDLGALHLPTPVSPSIPSPERA
jgi:glycosyltransferase involved in cell wall biosynthesis